MFKSKTDFNAFDKNNDKVKNLEMTKVKALSKSASKKLQGKPENKTPFHLILHYFKDEKDKVLGHFIDFGENKKLAKHFQQIEMKSGKLDKSMSASPKEAATGLAYVKEENGKKMICFEPDPNSKIPKAKWPKILKGLKSFLGGLKGVLVLDGTIISEEEKTEETSDETTEEETSRGTSSSETDTSGIKKLLDVVSKALKETLPKDIIPKIKNKTVQAEDGGIVEDILDHIQEFVTAFDEAAQPVKEKLQGVYDTIQKQAPQVEKIREAIEKLLASSNGSPASQEDTSVIDELLRLAKEGIGEFDKRYDQLQKNLEEESQAPMPGGEALLNELN